MKKTFNISIAQTLFVIEEDAYQKLEAYLNSVKAHFSNTVGSEEIISDIENRLAEQLLESKEKIVTLANVERILGVMGKVEDFEDSTSEEIKEKTTENKTKKLYRNPDDVIIAGVCSGLAAYFNIEVLLIRLAFVLFTIITGFGILLYVVLWLLVPEAKTKAQKLEMAGSPVTLETLSESFEKKTKNENLNGLRKFLESVFRFFGKIFQLFFRVLKFMIHFGIGIVLVIISLFIIIAILVTSGFLISGNVWLTGDVQLATLIPGVFYPIVLSGVALAIFIPVLFVLIAGLSLIKKKSVISSVVGFGLLGIWFISLLICGFGVSKVMDSYQAMGHPLPPVFQIESFDESDWEVNENGVPVFIDENSLNNSTNFKLEKF